jgi:hypothetical protein
LPTSKISSRLICEAITSFVENPISVMAFSLL